MTMDGVRANRRHSAAILAVVTPLTLLCVQVRWLVL